MWKKVVFLLSGINLQFLQDNTRRHINANKTRYCLNKYITGMSRRECKNYEKGHYDCTFFVCLLSESVYEDAYLCLMGLQSTHCSLMQRNVG